MTARHDTDRLIAAWLVDTNPEGPVEYLDETLEAIGGLSQRSAWTSLGRWLPARLTLPRVAAPRAALPLAVLAVLLLGVLLALAIAGSQKRLPPPFGLAATGLVAFEQNGDIVATLPDGSGLRTLVAGPGVHWDLTWSHRGDRFAYWTTMSKGTNLQDDPAFLSVADADGSNQLVVSGGPVWDVGDVLPNATWSPDDRQLAFANEGVLYVVNADGTNQHQIGDDSHTRDGPVWSPDGSLIAYTGQPIGDPYNNNSLYVITPDGRNDTNLFKPDGAYEIGSNSNPSWSPDSRSLLVHVGGADLPNSIAMASRDDAGNWDDGKVIAGPLPNFLPAWSNDGTRFTFLQEIPGSPDLYVMVADADVNHVRQLSNRHVNLTTPCWTPDDRYIRAEAAGAERSIVLIPLDPSQPEIDIPAGDGVSAGCSPQRRAP